MIYVFGFYRKFALVISCWLSPQISEEVCLYYIAPLFMMSEIMPTGIHHM